MTVNSRRIGITLVAAAVLVLLLSRSENLQRFITNRADGLSAQFASLSIGDTN